MHKPEEYLDALYCLKDKAEEEIIAFAKTGNFDPKGIQHFDTLMHGAKNLDKVIDHEEGAGEEYDEYSGSTQGRGRAIRTTPGVSMDDGYSGENSMRSMRGNSYRSMRSMRGTSGRRDARGRFARSGAADDTIEKLRRKADMTTDHDERDILLNAIDWIENEE